MTTIVIDLMGDDDMIIIGAEKTPEEVVQDEARRKHALEEIFRRLPRPALEIVPTEPGR